jgi:hypothetical protein
MNYGFRGGGGGNKNKGRGKVALIVTFQALGEFYSFWWPFCIKLPCSKIDGSSKALVDVTPRYPANL